jgi:tyrosinase
MSRGDRKEYIEAVTCLIKKPALSKPTDVPGARNRLDDFAAAHIQQSNNIHFNGNLYAWHRYFTWAYEKALREECGYKGSQPYWDWTLSADDPRKSPVFDGSPYSMGSNGKVTFHGATLLTAFGKQFTLPPGTGGGCVEKGPFSDLIVNLGVNPTIIAPVPAPVPAQGPDASAAQNSTSNSSAPVDAKLATSPTLINPALQYNPRCLTRDINLFWSNQTHASDVEFLLACPNVDCLEKRADGWELPADQPQPLIHAAGHFSVGGLQNDPFASPGDPIFYLHHAQFDRVWSMWQAQDSKNRVYQVGGTKTPFNSMFCSFLYYLATPCLQYCSLTILF